MTMECEGRRLVEGFNVTTSTQKRALNANSNNGKMQVHKVFLQVSIEF